MTGGSDRRTAPPRIRAVVRAFACVAFALVLAACGARNTGGGTAPTIEPIAYTWDLPVIDTAADGTDGEIYQALRKSCDDGDTMITQKWRQSSSPRNVLLFAAGVQACRGDVNQARTLYVRARDEYGLTGLGPVQDAARCDVYKSVASVLEKAPRDRFPCLDGASPDFRRAADGTPDNPLTAVDESAVVPTTTSAAPPATPTPATTRAPKTIKAPSSPTRHPRTTTKFVPTTTEKAVRADDGKDDDSDDSDSTSKDDEGEMSGGDGDNGGDSGDSDKPVDGGEGVGPVPPMGDDPPMP